MFRLESMEPIRMKPESSSLMFEKIKQKFSEIEKENENSKKDMIAVDEEVKLKKEAEEKMNLEKEQEIQKQLHDKKYEELRTYIEERFKKVDEVVEYAKGLENKFEEQKAEQKLFNKLIVDKNQLANQNAELRKADSKYIEQRPIEPTVQPLINPNQPVLAPQENTKPKKGKKTYFEITDPKYDEIVNKYTELIGASKKIFFSDGNMEYIEINKKKLPLDYKSILKYEKLKKNKLKIETPKEENNNENINQTNQTK